MEILDDLSEEKKQPPRINPFEPPKDSEKLKKVKLYLLAGSSIFFLLTFMLTSLQKTNTDWKDIIMEMLGLGVIICTVFRVAGFIICLILNFFIFLVGKIVIEPIKSHKLSSIYQKIYLDINLSVIFINLILSLVFFYDYFYQSY
jgi:hypothetical protein